MGRYSKGQSYGHKCRQLDVGCYEISWVVDYYYTFRRLRYPRYFSRITDSDGATRFRRKWAIT